MRKVPLGSEEARLLKELIALPCNAVLHDTVTLMLIGEWSRLGAMHFQVLFAHIDRSALRPQLLQILGRRLEESDHDAVGDRFLELAVCGVLPN